MDLTANKVTSPGPPALPSVQLSTAWKTVPLPAPQTWDSLTIGSQEEGRVFLVIIFKVKLYILKLTTLTLWNAQLRGVEYTHILMKPALSLYLAKLKASTH